jgi:hypothetical protein
VALALELELAWDSLSVDLWGCCSQPHRRTKSGRLKEWRQQEELPEKQYWIVN